MIGSRSKLLLARRKKNWKDIIKPITVNTYMVMDSKYVSIIIYLPNNNGTQSENKLVAILKC